MKYLIAKKETVLVKNPQYQVLKDGSVVNASISPMLSQTRYLLCEFGNAVELVKFFETLSPEEISNCTRYDISNKFECEPVISVHYKDTSLV